ncbi:hypothetical protein PIB30_079610 [Stylosanthes scabra]|uniref:Uncharacterized protein n=1 Tax=Stylosanthes scabra TaxID=79078 RepID=A0ABU6TTE9_9FABA|nr:hypothetical protein [Stylosanthes scabra]
MVRKTAANKRARAACEAPPPLLSRIPLRRWFPSKEIWHDFEDLYSKMPILKPKFLTEGLLPEDKNGHGDFRMVFNLADVEYALGLDGLASIWGLQNRGITFKGGSNPHMSMVNFDCEVAQRMLRVTNVTSEKYSIGRMTTDHRLLHYVLTYVLLPRKGNHRTVNEEDLIILWATVKECELNWPYLITHKLMYYTTGQIETGLGHSMIKDGGSHQKFFHRNTDGKLREMFIARITTSLMAMASAAREEEQRWTFDDAMRSLSSPSLHTIVAAPLLEEAEKDASALSFVHPTGASPIVSMARGGRRQAAGHDQRQPSVCSSDIHRLNATMHLVGAQHFQVPRMLELRRGSVPMPPPPHLLNAGGHRPTVSTFLSERRPSHYKMSHTTSNPASTATQLAATDEKMREERVCYRKVDWLRARVQQTPAEGPDDVLR